MCTRNVCNVLFDSMYLCAMHHCPLISHVYVKLENDKLGMSVSK